jgi:hypothetical protein
VVWQMPFKQFNPFVNLINQSSSQSQLMDVADSAIRDCLMTPVNIVANIDASHHRSRLVAPISFLNSFTYFSLALCQFF